MCPDFQVYPILQIPVCKVTPKGSDVLLHRVDVVKHTLRIKELLYIIHDFHQCVCMLLMDCKQTEFKLL